MSISVPLAVSKVTGPESGVVIVISSKKLLGVSSDLSVTEKTEALEVIEFVFVFGTVNELLPIIVVSVALKLIVVPTGNT